MTIARTILLLAAAALPSAAALAGAVTLRPRAGLAPDRAEVRLADIADLAGDDAAALADVVVLPDAVNALRGAGGSITLDIHAVRAALDARRVNWGRITLQGAVCTVRAVAATEPTAPEPPAPVPSLAAAPPEPVSALPGGTVRAMVARRIGELLHVAADDLRLTFEPDPILEAPVEKPGRRVDVRIAAAGGSPRMPAQVTIYDGDRITASAIVYTAPMVRKTAVVLTAPVRKGEVITGQHVRETEQWGPPGIGAGVDSAAEVVGTQARTRMAPGAALRDDSVVKPVLIRRGELATVHAMSGSVLVKTPARAITDGREGEVIEFRLEKSKKTFTARVDGKARAVLVINQPDARDGADPARAAPDPARSDEETPR